MQPRPHTTQAFTRIELIVVIAVMAILAALLLSTFVRNRQKAERTRCVNNLKQIGTAYRIWVSTDGYPAGYQNRQGGWRDTLDQTNGAQYCWTNYALMQNELRGDPTILICPSDERRPARDFKSLRNINISYLVGADADDGYPQSILAGDRNLAPGLIPKNDYGFSKPNGEGNDIWIKTNSALDPICWSLKMHSYGDPIGSGHILLGDGSVQQTSSALLRSFQTNAAVQSRWSISTNLPDRIRLIFP